MTMPKEPGEFVEQLAQAAPTALGADAVSIRRNIRTGNTRPAAPLHDGRPASPAKPRRYVLVDYNSLTTPANTAGWCTDTRRPLTPSAVATRSPTLIAASRRGSAHQCCGH